MALLPVTVVEQALEGELPAARAWAERHGYELHCAAAELSLRVGLEGPDAEPYQLEAVFEDYPTLPPTWRFVDPRTAERIGRAAYPAAPVPCHRGSPLVIDSGREGVVICAHFNRLAFAEEGGPHGDWGALADWQNPPASNYTFAVTIGDMLARIALEVRESVGRKAPLP